MRTPSRSVSLRLAALGCVLVAGASCSDGTHDGEAVGTPDADVVPWTVVDPTFDGRAQHISSMVAVDGAYLAAGLGFDDRPHELLKVWRSDDLTTFEEVWSVPCCDRRIDHLEMQSFGDEVIIGAQGNQQFDQGEWVSQSWLWVSGDGGSTWREVEHPAFVEAGQSFYSFTVTDAGVVAQITGEQAEGVGVGAERAWFSNDLVDWSPVDLPGVHDGDRLEFVTDGSEMWAHAQLLEATAGGVVSWHSEDGGATFIEDTPLKGDASMVAAVDGSLVVWPVPSGDPEADVETGPWVLRGDARWERLESEVGQWADGTYARPAAIRHQEDGRLIAGISRTRRANPHHCYPDPSTCELTETAVVTSKDGHEWFELQGAVLADHSAEGLILGEDGSIVVWGARLFDAQGRPSTLQIIRWDGPALPELEDPEGDPPPDRPVPFYKSGPLQVGEERRFILETGNDCGRTTPYIAGQQWTLVEPLPSPLPASWPIRPVTWMVPQPEPWVYGRIERISDGEIVFSIEGVGPVATFELDDSIEQWNCI